MQGRMEWISVRNELPIQNQSPVVVVSNKKHLYNCIAMASFCRYGWSFLESEKGDGIGVYIGDYKRRPVFMADDITHWMPFEYKETP